MHRSMFTISENEKVELHSSSLYIYTKISRNSACIRQAQLSLNRLPKRVRLFKGILALLDHSDQGLKLGLNTILGR